MSSLYDAVIERSDEVLQQAFELGKRCQVAMAAYAQENSAQIGFR
jgi:hypothetical protein